MEKDKRQNSRPGQIDRNRELQRASHPAPGKVTRTSKLSPSRGAAVQRKGVAPVAAPQGGVTAPKARSPWELTMDPWMDAAHRGVTALAERGHDMVQAAGPIQAKGLQENPEAPVRPSGHGGGVKMPEEVRGKMEIAFGRDFSSVRIHEEPHTEAVGALAYTQGMDIYFAPGQYQPTSQRGQELLGHELTHVVQQSQGRVQTTTKTKGMDINDDASLEHEADEMGARAARGEASRVQATRSNTLPMDISAVQNELCKPMPVKHECLYQLQTDENSGSSVRGAQGNLQAATQSAITLAGGFALMDFIHPWDRPTLGQTAEEVAKHLPPAHLQNLHELTTELVKIRNLFDGAGIRLSSAGSGYRTPATNRRLDGAARSQHMLGKAADIRISGQTSRQVYERILQAMDEGTVRPGGLGLNNSFVHYDTRGTITLFDYGSASAELREVVNRLKRRNRRPAQLP